MMATLIETQSCLVSRIVPGVIPSPALKTVSNMVDMLTEEMRIISLEP